MKLSTALAVVLVPVCVFTTPAGSFRLTRSVARGRREEFSLIASAYASDVEPKRRDPEFLVRVYVLHRDAVVEACRALGAWEGDAPRARQPAGCNRVYLDRTPMLCEVYVEEPRYDRDERMTTWGHEFFHCYAGRYH